MSSKILIKSTLDVRLIRPPQRHPAVFAEFDALNSGEAFILVNDHDPRPLWYQFQAERPDIFDWEYLEQGPTEWRVRISRV